MKTGWHPNRAQWVVIWCTVLIATHFWLGLDLSDFMPKDGLRWGLLAYLDPLGYRQNRSPVAVVVVAIGLLLVWQLSGNKVRQEPPEKEK